MKGLELKLFIEHAPIAAAMFDRDMRYVAASTRWLTERGLDSSILGRNAFDVYPAFPEGWSRAYCRAIAGEAIAPTEDHLEKAHGQIEWLRWEVRPWREINGQVGGVVIFAEDITAQKRAEEALRKSEERYRYAIEATNDGIWDWDIRADRVVHSPAYHQMLGYDAPEWEAGRLNLWSDLLHPDDRDRIVGLARELLRSPGHYQLEFRLRHKDGSYRWILSRGRTVEWGEQGAPIRAVGTHTDITDRRQAETAVKESESRFRHLADSAPVMIWMSGTDQLCYYFNRTWLAFTGRTLEQELGNGWTEGVHPEDYETCLQVYIDSFALRQGFEMEYRLRRNDGVYRWILDCGVPRYDDDGSFLGYIGSCVDISARKDAEDALLQRSEDRYRRIVETAQEGVWLLDDKAKTIFVNPKMAELLGYTTAEMVGRDLLTFMDEEWKRVAEKKLVNRAAGVFETHDFKFRRKNGSELWALVNCAPILEGSVYQGALAMVMDFTDRKRLEGERQRYLDELKETYRRKDEFLATLGHELRTPLATIKLGMDLLEDQTNTLGEHSLLFARMQRQVKHLTRIVEDILQVSRIARGMIELRCEALDLNKTLAQIEDSFRIRFEQKGIKLDVRLAQQDLPIHGDTVRLSQVFGNLLDNALKYTDAGGTVLVSVARQGDEAEVSVCDNGIGVPPEQLTWIFELFNRMKNGPERAREGIGVGLALARSLVQLHLGSIEAKSEGVGKGTEFMVRLPLAVQKENTTKSRVDAAAKKS